MNKSVALLLISASILFANNKSVSAIAHDYKIGYKKDFDYVNNIGIAFNYFEFKGYVKAILDSSSRYSECKNTFKLKDIAYKTAILVTNAKQVNYISTLVAVDFACNLNGDKK